MDIQEEYIIDKLKLNNEVGLQLLFDKYYTPLCIYALNFIESYSDAEDLVQDIFIKFWEKKIVDSLRISLKAYLFKAVKNNALNLIRTNNKFQIEALYENFDFEDEYVDTENFEAKKQKLYIEIDKLPPKRKAIFTAIIFENKKYKDVAKELNISLNTVKTQFSKALKQLRTSVNTIVFLLI